MTPTTWPEDPSFQHQPPPGLSYVREKNGVGPMYLCGLLGYTPCPLKMQSPGGRSLVGKAKGEGESSLAVQSKGAGGRSHRQAGRRERGWWLGSVCTGGQRGVLFRRILGETPTRASC